MNIYNSFIVLILLGYERGATQTLNCTFPDVIQLGEPLEIGCTVSDTVQFYNLVTLAKDGVNIVILGRFENGARAIIDANYLTRLNHMSSTVRKLTVRYSAIHCSDNGIYEWTFQMYVGNSTSTLRKQIMMAIKVIPEFGTGKGNNISYSPSTNLVEGDTVTFTCQCDVGNNPPGYLFWFYSLNGSTTAVDVSNKATTQAPQDSTVAGRTCSKTRVSTLPLTLTKEMHSFVVRCTVNQDQPFTAVGQGYTMTQHIHIVYKPTIRSLTRVPESVQYTDGDALLAITCTATSNPAPEYFWTFESVYTNRTQISTGNQLVLRNLNLNSTGVYTCVAYNLIKGVIQTTNASTQITVDATVIGATVGVTLAVCAIILAVVCVFIGRRYRCVKRQENDNGRNARGAPATVEFDEYQNTPYYSMPRMYETLERTPDANEPYTQLESAGGHS